MKTFRLIGMALVAVMMCLNFAACGSDDDDTGGAEEKNSIVGTWKYSSNDMGQGAFTFNSNGTLIWDDGEETTSNHTYNLTGDNLKIIFNSNDDYIIGKISFSGKSATYKYTWHDCAGDWDEDEEQTMTLTKQ